MRGFTASFSFKQCWTREMHLHICPSQIGEVRSSPCVFETTEGNHQSKYVWLNRLFYSLPFCRASWWLYLCFVKSVMNKVHQRILCFIPLAPKMRVLSWLVVFIWMIDVSLLLSLSLYCSLVRIHFRIYLIYFSFIVGDFSVDFIIRAWSQQILPEGKRTW